MDALHRARLHSFSNELAIVRPLVRHTCLPVVRFLHVRDFMQGCVAGQVTSLSSRELRHTTLKTDGQMEVH